MSDFFPKRRNKYDYSPISPFANFHSYLKHYFNDIIWSRQAEKY